jgi:hypothetical protein
MELWTGYIGLAIAFVIITAIVLWFSIRTPGQVLIKAILIPTTIWYGLALYYTVPNLVGWPASKPIPDNSQVIAIRINEPNPLYNDPGAIYFWVQAKPSPKSTQQKTVGLLNPKSISSVTKNNRPRAYQLPYSRKMHREILEAQRKAKGMPGAQIKTKKGSAKGSSKRGIAGLDQSQAALQFEIVNPVQSFPK